MRGRCTLLCTRPPAKSAKSPKSGGDASGLALLLLGHRGRLMFTTLCSNVVKPVVSSGVPVDLFAFLENSTMAKAFRGRRPMGNPAFAQLGDKELAARVAADVSAHGGRIASIRIGPRPVVELPANRPERLSRYTEHVKRTVATRFLKERLGYEMVQAYEAANDKRYAWVLWTREDSHWFKPLDLSLFKRGAVHGKACGGFGGWNDKVWLMDREWAGPMLSMYDDFHMDHPAKCTDLAHSSSNGVDSSSRGGGGGPCRSTSWRRQASSNFASGSASCAGSRLLSTRRRICRQWTRTTARRVLPAEEAEAIGCSASQRFTQRDACPRPTRRGSTRSMRVREGNLFI